VIMEFTPKEVKARVAILRKYPSRERAVQPKWARKRHLRSNPKTLAELVGRFERRFREAYMQGWRIDLGTAFPISSVLYVKLVTTRHILRDELRSKGMTLEEVAVHNETMFIWVKP
jgi:hypothetical protein